MYEPILFYDKLWCSKQGFSWVSRKYWCFTSTRQPLNQNLFLYC